MVSITRIVARMAQPLRLLPLPPLVGTGVLLLIAFLCQALLVDIPVRTLFAVVLLSLPVLLPHLLPPLLPLPVIRPRGLAVALLPVVLLVKLRPLVLVILLIAVFWTKSGAIGVPRMVIRRLAVSVTKVLWSISFAVAMRSCVGRP